MSDDETLKHMIEAAAALLLKDFPVDEVVADRLDVRGVWVPGLQLNGLVDWHVDQYHPRYTGLLVLRNDLRLKLHRAGYKPKPMPVGACIVFDSQRQHAAFGDTGEGLFVAAIHESDCRASAQRVRNRLIAAARGEE